MNGGQNKNSISFILKSIELNFFVVIPDTKWVNFVFMLNIDLEIQCGASMQILEICEYFDNSLLYFLISPLGEKS